MKAFIITAAALGISIVGNAQQKQKEPAKTKFTPPVIVKDEPVKSKAKTDAVKFTPPVITKDKPTTIAKKKQANKVKFTPPVIVKDPQ